MKYYRVSFYPYRARERETFIIHAESMAAVTRLVKEGWVACTDIRIKRLMSEDK